MIDLVFKNYTSQKAPKQSFFKNVLGVVVEELKLGDKNRGVSINLVGEAKIKSLNKKYRNKNKVTDVLSFPMDDKHDLGDIFICLPFAKKQAKSENINIERKLAQLTVHGFLHLLGYDHERSNEDEKKMVDLEVSIISKLNLD